MGLAEEQLVRRARNSRAKAQVLLQDRICSGRSAERSCYLVVVGDEVLDLLKAEALRATAISSFRDAEPSGYEAREAATPDRLRWVRSRFWICAFSSTQSTTALSGGVGYSPTMSLDLRDHTRPWAERAGGTRSLLHIDQQAPDTPTFSIAFTSPSTHRATESPPPCSAP